MASDYEIKKKRYDEYRKLALIDPRVEEEMLYQLRIANTVDFEAAEKANRILSGNKGLAALLKEVKK